MVNINMGLCHTTLGHVVRALWAFDRADKLLPGRWETARAIGGLYFMLGRYEKAVKWLVQALTPNVRAYLYQPIQADYYGTWDLIGHSFAKLDKNAEAVRAWEQALKHAQSEDQKKITAEKIALVKTLLPNNKP